MSKFKSKITKVSNIDYNKTFHIEQLFADPKMLEMHANRIKQLYPKASDEMIRNQIDQIIIKENSFNLIMQYIVSNFKVEFEKTELEEFKKRFAAQFNENDPAKLLDIAQKLITKGLVFEVIAKEKNLLVDDLQARQYLDNYYKATNNSINEFLNNKDKFNEIKDIILEEKITQFLIDTFKVYLNVKTILHNNQQQANKPAQAQNPANKPGVPPVKK